MVNRKPEPLAACGRDLVRVARGELAAELVIRRVTLVNVHTAELQRHIDIAVYGGRIALVGEAGFAVGPRTREMDAQGCYLAPGFLDAHIHVESSMLTLSEFSRAVVPRGTVGIFMDPHEIANVLGIKGVRLLCDEGENVLLRVYMTIPSCVPAAGQFETAGAVIGVQEVREAMHWPRVVGLGEMMNYPGVLHGDDEVTGKIAETLAAGKVVTGHFPAGSGADLCAYTAAGISSCHESVCADEVLAKLRLGMYAQLREGSAWQDVKRTIRAVVDTGIDSRHVHLVTDDAHPQTLLEEGHLDRVVRRAIAEGLDPLKAIQMVSINVAAYYGLAGETGSIAPGKVADMLLLSDLPRVKVEEVFMAGEPVAGGGRLLAGQQAFTYPGFARDTVRLAAPLKPADLQVKSNRAGRTTVRVIEVVAAQAGTLAAEVELPVNGGLIEAQPEIDIAKLAVVERHQASGRMGRGFVRGFGLRTGAVASTVAHDSHNLLILGVNDRDMALAGNLLADCGGGMAAVRNGKVLALLPLPLAGLISDRPVEEVNSLVSELAAAWKELGSSLPSPFMTLSLLSLPVIPQLRLTDRGLVDVRRFALVDLEI